MRSEEKLTGGAELRWNWRHSSFFCLGYSCGSLMYASDARMAFLCHAAPSDDERGNNINASPLAQVISPRHWDCARRTCCPARLTGMEIRSLLRQTDSHCH